MSPSPSANALDAAGYPPLRRYIRHVGVQAHAARRHEQQRAAGHLVLHTDDFVALFELDRLERAFDDAVLAPRRLLDHAVAGVEQQIALRQCVGDTRHVHDALVVRRLFDDRLERQALLAPLAVGQRVHVHLVAVAEIGEAVYPFVGFGFDDAGADLVLAGRLGEFFRRHGEMPDRHLFEIAERVDDDHVILDGFFVAVARYAVIVRGV